MGKLTNLRGRVKVLPPRVASRRDAEGHSKSAEPWRAWYSLARWKRLRMATLKRDGFRCQCGCGRLEGNTSLLVADHKTPHRGDPALFWDPDNLQTLFKPCHDSRKQAEERRAR